MGDKRIIEIEESWEDPENLFTEEEQLDQCCEPVSVDVCADVGKVSRYTGRDREDWNFDPDLLEQKYKAQYGDKFVGVNLIPIGPKGDCGKKYESWTDKNNCCEFIEPMEWDYDNSAEVVVPGGMALVRVTGGAAPYRVSVRGEGFTLDGYRRRDGVYTTPYFWVFAESFACGWCPIEVNDGCTIVRGGIRSALGQWVEDVYASPCSVPGRGVFAWNSTVESIVGRYKVRQICGNNAVNCQNFGLPCSAENIAGTAAWVCTNWSPGEQPCFSLPGGITACESGVYWEYDGASALKIYTFTGYKVWEWVC